MEQHETDTSTRHPPPVIRPASRWSLARAVRVASWLGVSAAFGHLIVDAISPIRLEMRAALAIAALASLAMASLTAAGEDRWTPFASTALALGLLVFSGSLIAMRLAHETGVVLLAGCALNVILVWLDARADRVPQSSGGDRQ